MRPSMSTIRKSTTGAGLNSMFQGFRFLFANPRLWAWAIIPFIIQLLCLIGLIMIFSDQADSLFSWLTKFLGDNSPLATDATTWDFILHWVFRIVSGLIWLLLWMMGIIIASLTSFVFGMIISGPFNDALSARTELISTGRVAENNLGFFADLQRSIMIEVQKACLFLFVPAALLFLHLFPGVGSLLYLVITGIFEMWATGFSFVDYPMGRRGFNLSTRLKFARLHKGALTSFGAIFWIPGALIFCAPALIVGGTLLFNKLEPDLK